MSDSRALYRLPHGTGEGKQSIMMKTVHYRLAIFPCRFVLDYITTVNDFSSNQPRSLQQHQQNSMIATINTITDLKSPLQLTWCAGLLWEPLASSLSSLVSSTPIAESYHLLEGSRKALYFKQWRSSRLHL